ncbi:hypothetical protein ACFW15_15995, partial [Streptomyces sp. NPDC058953]
VTAHVEAGSIRFAAGDRAGGGGDGRPPPPPPGGGAGRGREFLDEVMAHVAERVAPYQKVRELHVVDALPLTPTGKILKTRLRQLLRDDPR